jgi:hypothetical protein
MDLAKARKGLLLLLERFPDAMIAEYDAQLADGREPGWFDYGGPAPGEPGGWEPKPAGPWVCIDLTDGRKFAIWKETGDVYAVGEGGAVEEDPLIAVTP